MAAEECPWIVRQRAMPENATMRAFIFYAAGASASQVAPLGQALPPSCDRCVVELPGRGTRGGEAPQTDPQALVAEMTEAIAGAGLLDDLPFIVVAHSLGCALGFLFARAVQRLRGVEPLGLFVITRRAPHAPMTPQDGWFADQATHLLNNHQFVSKAKSFWGHSPGLAAVVKNQALLDEFAPVLRADLMLGAAAPEAAAAAAAAAGDEEGAPALSCPVHAFAALAAPPSDPDSSERTMREWRAVSASFTLHDDAEDATHASIVGDADLLSALRAAVRAVAP